MTIDEYIKHCEEVVESCERGNPKKRSKAKCASEHRQLAEWLKELKAYREARVGCEYCKHKFREQHERPCSLCQRNFMDMFEREVNADEDSD